MFEQMSSGRIKGSELCINCIASLHREELFQVKDCSPQPWEENIYSDKLFSLCKR